jgi:hypothetical protein
MRVFIIACRDQEDIANPDKRLKFAGIKLVTM